MGDFKCISRFDSVTSSPDDIGIFGNDTEHMRDGSVVIQSGITDHLFS